MTQVSKYAPKGYEITHKEVAGGIYTINSPNKFERYLIQQTYYDDGVAGRRRQGYDVQDLLIVGNAYGEGFRFNQDELQNGDQVDDLLCVAITDPQCYDTGDGENFMELTEPAALKRLLWAVLNGKHRPARVRMKELEIGGAAEISSGRYDKAEAPTRLRDAMAEFIAEVSLESQEEEAA